MSTTDALLAEIESFCEEFDILESTFGRRAMSDGKFVERIRRGGGLTVANLDRIHAYMAGEREKATLAVKEAAAAAPRRAPRSRTFREAAPTRRRAA